MSFMNCIISCCICWLNASYSVDITTCIYSKFAGHRCHTLCTVYMDITNFKQRQNIYILMSLLAWLRMSRIYSVIGPLLLGLHFLFKNCAQQKGTSRILPTVATMGSTFLGCPRSKHLISDVGFYRHFTLFSYIFNLDGISNLDNCNFYDGFWNIWTIPTMSASLSIA
nr:uncharacterized protein LOC108015674 [Drosophila suzukii]